MTVRLESIFAVIDEFDVAVLDQWGVLHRGEGAFPDAVETVARLAREGKRVVVLTNSGKRASLNQRRIESLGFPRGAIDHVVSSGEVAWRDIASESGASANGKSNALFPISASPSDAREWLGGDSAIEFAFRPEQAQRLLLMGLADDAGENEFDSLFETAIRYRTGMICTNPDKISMRGGTRCIAPGFLAQKFADMGGHVEWYGKPYAAVFDAVRSLYPDIPRERFLMVGDSIEHDIAGANRAEFASMLVISGVHEPSLAAKSEKEMLRGIETLAMDFGTGVPDYCIDALE